VIGELGAVLGLGFVLGMRHATDADHVVAVTTIVARQRSLVPAAWVGAIWGTGHTITVLLVGGAIVLFRIAIPPRVGLAMEFAVGAMLVVLGVLALRNWWRERHDTHAWTAIGLAAASTGPHGLAATPHAHPHPHVLGAAHDHVHVHHDFVHAHPHTHGPGGHGHAEGAVPTAWLDRHLGGLRGYAVLRPLIIGLVHGMAGSAAVALLALAAIDDPWAGLAYLLVFGIGTVAGMVLITALVALPFAWSAARVPHLNRGLHLVAGIASLLFGLWLMGELGIAGGLFGPDPQWTPR
jgi:high-affinity nickel-transport protein